VRTLAFAAVAALAFAAPAAGQTPRVRDVPRRPVLWAQADTNSANAYYTHGMTRLADNPAEAAAAFYWAARLQPGSADALYGRRVALLMTDRDRLVRYMRGERSTRRHPEILAIDSLQLRALALDPFLVQKFDRSLMRTYVLGLVLEDMRRDGGVDNPALARHQVDTWLSRTMDPGMRAWAAYSEGRFPQAIEYFEQSLRRARPRDRAGIRADLGRIHFFSGNLDKAVEHFTAGVAEMRKDEDRDLVFVYESKALLEHSAGTVYEKMGNAAAAQEAYGRALQEDLSFAAAHRRLGMLALARGDTAAAVSALALAVELSPADPELRVQHGLVLVLARNAPAGVAELAKAVELEPLYAAPRLLLARINDASGIAEQALEHYRAYLERAPRDDAGYADAQQRVAALDAQLKAAP
jgi:tetratricopeptide (TPR) repeat protein